jgi:integrase
VASAAGVYPYETSAGTRWRFAFRQSDGSLSNRRGFASPRAAATAKRRLEESIRRGEVKVARDTFAMWWATFLSDRRHYVSAGTLEDYETHGRKRLLPFFGELRLDGIDEPLVREWLGGLAARVEAGELSPKTVNNALTVLSVCLGEAQHRGVLVANPCARVRQLPVHDVEKDYLRLAEIGRYLDGCAAYYRPLAEFLIATGARISEALDVRWRDVEYDVRAVRIYRQRDRATSGSARTKGRRFRSVAVGPGLIQTLRKLRERSPAPLADDFVFLCPPARRGRYAGREALAPPHRKTVHDWHEAALTDAGLRDMPLHALRHTAAAAWLITGRPLVFVQRQLGHRSITTTERHYGHLEQSFLHAATEETEDAIRRAGTIGEWARGPRSAALPDVTLQRASE